MKRVRLVDRCWSQLQLQPSRNPRPHRPLSTTCEAGIGTGVPLQRRCVVPTPWQAQQRRGYRREASTSATVPAPDASDVPPPALPPSASELAPSAPDDPPSARIPSTSKSMPLNSPSPKQAAASAKLAALHARLSLPSQLPLQTLGRCLIDPSVDARPGYSNAPLAMLGQDLLAYYTAEHFLCHFPRLPMPILFAAQAAYAGPTTLNALREEWGVETVAAPGREVDPGLLQLKRVVPGTSIIDAAVNVRMKNARDQSVVAKRAKTGSRSIVYDDEFGEAPSEAQAYTGLPSTTGTFAKEGRRLNKFSPAELNKIQSGDRSNEPDSLPETAPSTVEAASAGFIRALFGALYLHAGSDASKAFHRDHILSRHLELHKLFDFTYPTRDLSRLCAREDFEPPVARLISETGRLSRTPVFVVGVFSGDDKLGEGAGASLNEARVRAAAAALRSWYLYSPPSNEIMVPSEATSALRKKDWKPQLIDLGEVIT